MHPFQSPVPTHLCMEIEWRHRGLVEKNRGLKEGELKSLCCMLSTLVIALSWANLINDSWFLCRVIVFEYTRVPTPTDVEIAVLFKYEFYNTEQHLLNSGPRIMKWSRICERVRFNFQRNISTKQRNLIGTVIAESGIVMNPINASLAGTSVAPRSPRPPRSPRLQQRGSPRVDYTSQLSTTSSHKAENGQLMPNRSLSEPEKDTLNSQGKLLAKQKSEPGKKAKRCAIMWWKSPLRSRNSSF